MRLDGAVVRAARTALGLSLAEVARRARLTLPTVRTAERGQRISRASAQDLSAALGVPLVQLVALSAEEIRANLRSQGLAPLAAPVPWAGGRAAVEAVLARVRSSPRPLRWCITGVSGIGKTSLAAQLAAELASDFPDGLIWVTDRSTPGRDTTPAVQLGIAAALGFADHLPAGRAVARAAFEAAFRARLWEKPRLLFLDDVGTPELVERFASAADPAWIIVTSSLRTVAEAFSETTRLGPLPPDASVELLSAHLGAARVAADAAGVEHLVRVLAGVPRSLQIAGRILSQDRFVRPGDYAFELEQPAAPEPTPPLWSNPHDPDASFSGAYRQLRRRLPADVWGAFGALAALSDVEIPERWAAAAMGLPLADARRCLSNLVDHYLVHATHRPDPGAGAGHDPAPPPRFWLDAQGARIAHWVAGAEAGEARRRLLEFAAAEAARLSRATLEEMLEVLDRDRAVWISCLDRAALSVTGADVIVPRDLAQVRPMEISPTAPERVLPEILGHLWRWLWLDPPAEAASWLVAGLGLVDRGEAHAEIAHLFGSLGALHTLSAVDFELAHGFFRSAAAAAERAGQPATALRFVIIGAGIAHAAGGPDAMVREVEAALPLAESLESGVGVSTLRANLAVARILSARNHEILPAAEAQVVRALELPVADDAPTRATRAICRINRAMIRRLQGQAVDAPEVDEALRTLAQLADDDLERYRAEVMASFLGVRPTAAVDLDASQRRIWLSVQRNAQQRRILKLTEVLAYLGLSGPWAKVHELFDVAAPGEPPCRIAATVPLVGAVLSVSMAPIALLYPFEPIAELLQGGGAEYARAFVEQAFGRDNPLHPILADLSARPAPGPDGSPDGERYRSSGRTNLARHGR